MGAPIVHSFLGLGLSDRGRWIAMFCDCASFPASSNFPLLPRGESPLTWLEDQFRRAETVTGKADLLREAVADLLFRDLAGLELCDYQQVLGTLVDLAAGCGFAEIGPKIRDWLRGDYLPDAVYDVDGHPIPLRQTLWSAAIAWGFSDNLLPFIKRDLGRIELGCGALCFSALGRLSLFDAIKEIPTTCAWPIPYRDEVIQAFLENYRGAARVLAEPHLLPAWEFCLGELRWNPDISELFQPYMDIFIRRLAEAGVELSKMPGEEKFMLKPKDREFSGLLIDIESYKRQLDERIVHYYEGLIANLTSTGWGASVHG